MCGIPNRRGPRVQTEDCALRQIHARTRGSGVLAMQPSQQGGEKRHMRLVGVVFV